MLRTSIAVGPKRSSARPNAAELLALRLDPVAGGFVEFDHFGQQQRLAGRRIACPGRAQPFEHQPFVRCVLVDDHQAVLGLGDDVGLRDLPARDAERVGDGIRNSCVGDFGAARGGFHRRPPHNPGQRLSLRNPPRRGRPAAPAEQSARSAAPKPARSCHAAIAPAAGRLRAALVAAAQRLAQARDDHPAHRRGIAKAHLGLGRVDVDVDLARAAPRGTAPAPRGDRARACRHRRRAPRRQQPVLHRAAVDEQVLVIGHAAIVGRQARRPRSAAARRARNRAAPRCPPARARSVRPRAPPALLARLDRQARGGRHARA